MTIVSLCAAMTSSALAWRPPPAVSALFRGGDGPVEVGPRPARLSGVDADDCAACHAEIAAEWRGSHHARSWTDPLFQTSYAREPDAFCRNCHAPMMARGAREPDARAAREGVSCAVCHVRGGRVLGTGARGGDAPPRRDPHPEARLPEMATAGFCGACHQFDFPAARDARGARGRSGEPMQDTVGEWSRSASGARGEACQACHMPWRVSPAGRRYRAHDFAALRDPARLRAAVRVAVEVRRARGAVAVRARLEGGVIGHAFPSGDLFREGAFSVWIDGDPATLRVERLARRYGATPSGRRREVDDTRVPAPGDGPARDLSFTLPDAPGGARVRWSLDHLRMPVDQALRHRVADADNRTRVAEGSAYVPGVRSGEVRTTPPP